MFDGIDVSKETVVRQTPQREAAWSAVAGALRAAWRRQRSRRAIAGLDTLLLKDIGVSYAEAEAEANKRFWVR